VIRAPGLAPVFTRDYIWRWCTRNEKSQVLVAAVIGHLYDANGVYGKAAKPSHIPHLVVEINK
jgi:hypothetical protein